MKKNSKVLFLSTIIAVLLLYLVSAIFTLGTAFSPASALEVRSTNPNRDQTYNNAFAVVDLVRTKQDPADSEKTYTAKISEIYVFVGEVRSHTVDASGNPYVELVFHFTTTNNEGANYYGDPIIAKIPVRELSGGYEWIKVFDAQSESEEKDYSRVKVSTPDSIDIYEVVFTDSTGYVFPSSANFGTPEQKSNANLLIDEQESFKYSQSKKYHFTDAELKTIASVNALKGGKIAISEGPFSTICYFVSVTIFHTNTFSLRIFDFLAGAGLLILAFAFAKSLFGEEKYGLMTLLSVLSLGAVFTASNFALCSMGTFFAVLSLFISSRYFIKHYYLNEMSEGVLCLLGVGLFYSLAVACNPAYALTLVGHIVLFAMARKRAYKKFKKQEKEAVGLQKEDVFLAYRKKNLISLGFMAIALLLLPTVLFVVTYSACAPVYKAYYDVNFVKGAIKCFFGAFKAEYVSSPFALFVGFGGVKLNGYYSFLNYFTCIFALLCFIFVTFAVFFGKRFSFFSKVDVIKNKYKIVTVAFLALCLPVFFGLTSSPYGFAGVSVFMCAYVAFAHSILVKCVKKDNVINLAFSVAIAIGLLTFAMAYVGYVGLAINSTVKSILYIWQVL